MWSSNSLPQQYLADNKPNRNNNNSLGLEYQTPIKQSNNIQGNKGTPFQFDFNFHFGGLWSDGQMPNNPVNEPINSSNSQQNKDSNFLLFKASMERSGYKLSPSSEMKLNNNIDYQYQRGLNDIYPVNTYQNEITKKNLSELFDNAKNDPFLSSPKVSVTPPGEERNIVGNMGNNHSNLSNNNNCNININNEHNMISNGNSNNNNNMNNINNNINFYNNQNYIHNKNNKTKFTNSSGKEVKNIHSNSFVFSSPKEVKKPKKIFECSGSTNISDASKSSCKKRRFRKNNEQLLILTKFFNENKNWSKKQLKEISKNTGLMENKVYKWLWDQRNKEFRSTRFIVNKKVEH